MQKSICYCCADLSLFHMEHEKHTNRNLLTNAFLDFYIKYLIVSQTVSMIYLRISVLYLGNMSHIIETQLAKFANKNLRLFHAMVKLSFLKKKSGLSELVGETLPD